MLVFSLGVRANLVLVLKLGPNIYQHTWAMGLFLTTALYDAFYSNRFYATGVKFYFIFFCNQQWTVLYFVSYKCAIKGLTYMIRNLRLESENCRCFAIFGLFGFRSGATLSNSNQVQPSFKYSPLITPKTSLHKTCVGSWITESTSPDRILLHSDSSCGSGGLSNSVNTTTLIFQMASVRKLAIWTWKAAKANS